MDDNIIKPVEGTINRTVNTLLTEYPHMEKDDLLQQAYLIIVWLYWKRWNPELSNWNTYVNNQLRGRLLRYIKKQVYDSMTHMFLNLDISMQQSDDEDEDTHTPEDLIPSRQPGPYAHACIAETVLSLSEDAQFVLNTILEGPSTFVDCFKSNGNPMPPRDVRANIRDKLREIGWSWPRIWRSFHEVKSHIRECYGS